jgi:hypothetical protein
MEQLILALAMMCQTQYTDRSPMTHTIQQNMQKECVAKTISCYVTETQYANTDKQKLSALAKCLQNK